MDYSKIFTKLRAEMRWSQEELGEKLGISQRTVSTIELGTRNASRTVKYRLDGVMKQHGMELVKTAGNAAVPHEQHSMPEESGPTQPTGYVSAGELMAVLERMFDKAVSVIREEAAASRADNRENIKTIQNGAERMVDKANTLSLEAMTLFAKQPAAEQPTFVKTLDIEEYKEDSGALPNGSTLDDSEKIELAWSLVEK
ncbi:MAG: helix-turn-helix domain-containing protein [Chitinispirillales bacterium]|jgi:transcriptional regulator with XRE-family HTH domain|nr:helix-turn-helix domain-containing protein [Chitinispirillales bacterium]